VTQNVKRNTIGRLALGFFAAMLVLTLLNQKIDALRTPTVATVWPKAGQINGAEYSTVLPTETLRQENGETAVYTGPSPDRPLTAVPLSFCSSTLPRPRPVPGATRPNRRARRGSPLPLLE